MQLPPVRQQYRGRAPRFVSSAPIPELRTPVTPAGEQPPLQHSQICNFTARKAALLNVKFHSTTVASCRIRLRSADISPLGTSVVKVEPAATLSQRRREGTGCRRTATQFGCAEAKVEPA
jgi:hypothetical protein